VQQLRLQEMVGRNAQESHSLIMSTEAPFNVIVVASYYKLNYFTKICHAAALMVVDRTIFGIEVIVKAAIMGSDPINGV
jgi:hypothetical protein